MSDHCDMEQNLAKLRALSKDDKSELGMLRSRIDEQSQLIMILKRRADDETISKQTLERINAELEEFRNNAEDELKRQLKKYNMLDARFSDLASNHEEMIRFKDDYKLRNAQLMRENAKLKEDNDRLFSQALLEKDRKISELDRMVTKLRDHFSELETSYEESEENALAAEEKYASEMKKTKSKLAETEDKLKEAQGKIKQLSEQSQDTDKAAQSKLTQLTREKDELLELTMSRGKIIQDKQTENKKLLAKVEQMEKRVRDMQAKFEREAAAVNSNLQVKLLREELEEANHQYESYVRDMEAFKKHSNTLLQKERELNERLRHLPG